MRRDDARRRLAALALAALAGAWAAATTAAVPGPAAARPGVIPDGLPYDSTRGDSVGEAALYLSWGAPHGMPGARPDIAIACDDTTRVDTLYLSIETGRDLPRLFGMYARVAFRPAVDDSLGPFWSFSSTGANPGSLPIQMDADDTFPCARPWIHPGIGAASYESSPASGELLTIYAVTPDDAAPISGRTRYCFARLLLLHRRCRMAGAAQPVCIEWREGGYSGGDDDLIVRKGAARFVSVNSPDGSVCAPYRQRGRVAAWRPAPPAPGSPAPADSARR